MKIENYLNLSINYYSMTQKIRNGLVKKLTLPLAIASLIFSGCGKKQLSFERYVLITKNDTNIFNELNPGLKRYLDTIYIIRKEDLKNYRDNVRSLACGNKIYLREDYEKEDLYHEAAHVRNTFLDSIGLNFSEKWKKIAKFEYKDDKIKYIYTRSNILWDITWEDGTIGPKDGCLNPGSGKSIFEDIAIFVESAVLYSQTPEQIIEYLHAKEYKKKEIKSLSRVYPIYFCNYQDKRYLEKLNLLKEYNFITNAEHDSLSKNLGSLNYLLKE